MIPRLPFFLEGIIIVFALGRIPIEGIESDFCREPATSP